MDINERLSLIRQVGEEIITEAELKSLLETKKHPTAYDGFEPSGTDIHIAQGLLRAININRMTKAGCKFKMLIADWHAWANNKMGGDLEKIQKVGEYYIEVWKACGMDPKKVKFEWASKLLKRKNYWKTVMQIARYSTLKRILRTVQIMGRSESDALQASQIFYPCMQAADIFLLKADICQLGMDQRKVNMLAREIGAELGFWKPVVVSHHMLSSLLGPEKVEAETIEVFATTPEDVFDIYSITVKKIVDSSEGVRPGLAQQLTSSVALFSGVRDTNVVTLVVINKKTSEKKEIEMRIGDELPVLGISLHCKEISRSPESKVTLHITPSKQQLTASVKMSKSKPETAIFMNDSKETIRNKIRNAYCPQGIIENNPVLEYCKYILFPELGKLVITKPEKFGGQSVEFNNYEELERNFKEGTLHPIDLKEATALALNELLEPIRDKLAKNEKVQNLLKEIKTFKVTR